MPDAAVPLSPDAYPHRVEAEIRYRDVDRQGHVNNAVTSSYLEHGRTLLFAEAVRPALEGGREWVVARAAIDYRREITWPGRVAIGTGVLSVGTTSLRLAQAVFAGDVCASAAEIVIVQLDSNARRPAPWSAAVRDVLAGLMVRPSLRARPPAGPQPARR